MLEKIWVWDPGSGKTLFRIPDPGLKGTTGSATLIVIIGRTGGGASFPGPAEDGSVPTPSTVGQTHEAPVNETPPTDEGNATATMLANSTPFTVDGAAALVGAAAAGEVGAAAAAVAGAATTATDGAERDACTPYERRSPVVAGVDSTPRGPTHPPPPSGPPPAQSHMAPEIEAKIPTHFH
jgi:hypothetical protein